MELWNMWNYSVYIYGILIKISPHLTVSQHNKLTLMLQEFKDCFTTKISDLSVANIDPVRLQLVENATPINAPPYLFAKVEADFVNIDDLIAAKILEPSGSPFSSPVFTIRSKIDNFQRMVCDMRRVNQNIFAHAQPLPSIQMVLNSLGNSKYFSKIDLTKAYFQLEVCKDSRKYLAIKTQADRLLQWCRIPNGVKVGSALFQAEMNKLLNSHLYNKCIAFLDGIVLWGDSFDQALYNLKIILTILKKANLKLNTNKCVFLTPELDVLGHTVSSKGVLPQQRNLDAVAKFPEPNSVKRVRQFLGLTGIFRRYIKDYSKIAAPLTDLLKDSNKNKKFIFNKEARIAFNTLKQCLINPPILVHFATIEQLKSILMHLFLVWVRF